MEFIPAIDLRGGKCVRLQQGDYNRETVFSENPLAVAKEFQSQGATRLHLVDLDGARGGSKENRTIVEAICESLEVPCEIGGGIRCDEIVDALFSIKISSGQSSVRRLSNNPTGFVVLSNAIPTESTLESMRVMRKWPSTVGSTFRKCLPLQS